MGACAYGDIGTVVESQVPLETSWHMALASTDLHLTPSFQTVLVDKKLCPTSE